MGSLLTFSRHRRHRRTLPLIRFAFLIMSLINVTVKLLRTGEPVFEGSYARSDMPTTAARSVRESV